jgi:hypothetical protein
VEELADGTLAVLWNVQEEHYRDHGAAIALAADGKRRPVGAFELFLADDVGDDAALAGVVEALAEARDSPDAELRQRRRWFSDTELVAALDHDSPWVRHAAESIVGAAHPDWYPAATAHVVANPSNER